MLRKFQDQDSYVYIYIYGMIVGLQRRTSLQSCYGRNNIDLWLHDLWGGDGWRPEGLRQLPLERAWHGEVAWWSPRQLDEMASVLQPWIFYSAVYIHPLIQFANSMCLPQTQELTYFKAKKNPHTMGHENSVFQRSNPHMNQFSEVNPVLQCFQRSNFHINMVIIMISWW